MVDCKTQVVNNKSKRKYKDLGDKVIGKVAREIQDIRNSSTTKAEYDTKVKEYLAAMKTNKVRIIKIGLQDQQVMAKAIKHIEQPEFKNKIDAIASIVSDEIYAPTIGGSYNIETVHKAIYQKYAYMVTTGFEEAGLMKAMVKGGLDKQIRLALWDMENFGKLGKDVDPNVRKAVEIHQKVSNGLQFEMEASGGTRGRIRGHLKRAYDYDLIGEATREVFIEDAFNTLDPVTIISPEKTRKSLGKTYDKITGSTASRIQAMDDSTISLMRSGGLDASMAKSRRWKFARGREHEFMQKYGKGNVFENLLSTIDKDARAAATIQRLGHKPHANFTKLMDKAELSLSGAEKKKFIAGRKKLFNKFEMTVFGPTSGTSKMAVAGANTRSFLSMVHLGGASATILPTDLMTQSLVRSFGQNKNLYTSLFKSAYDMVHMVSPKYRKAVTERMQLQVWDTVGEAMTRFGKETSLRGSNRGMRRAGHLFFKANLMSPLTSLAKLGGADSWSRHAADMSGFSMKELEAKYPIWASDLKRYDISNKEWDMIRSTSEKVHGSKMISPYSIENGLEGVSEIEIRDMRLKYNSLIQSKSMSLGNPNPGTKEKVAAGQLVDPDTVHGQFLRSVLHFKQFPMVMSRVQDSILSMPGGNKFLKAAKFQSNMFMAGVGATILTSVMRGETPEDFTLVSFLSAVKRGGGFGIWGEFLIPAPGNFSDKIVGPTGSLVGKVAEMAYSVVSKNNREQSNFKAAKAVRFGYDYSLGVVTKLPMFRYLLHEEAFGDFMMMIDPRAEVNREISKQKRGIQPLIGE